MARPSDCNATWTDCMACPLCTGSLRVDAAGSGQDLECEMCGSRYPVHDGVPSFLATLGSEPGAEMA